MPNITLQKVTCCRVPAPDLDGGGPGAEKWWEAPCADTEYLSRGWSMKSLVFPSSEVTSISMLIFMKS